MLLQTGMHMVRTVCFYDAAKLFVDLEEFCVGFNESIYLNNLDILS